MQKSKNHLNNIFPDFNTYKSTPKSYNSVELSLRIDNVNSSPIDLFNKYSNNKPSFIMQITMPGSSIPKKTFMSIESLEVISTRDKNPIPILRSALHKHSQKVYSNNNSNNLGIFGYISYECYKYFESIDLKNDPIDCPESFFIIPKTMFAFDHQNKSVIITHILPTNLDENNYELELKKVILFSKKIKHKNEPVKYKKIVSGFLSNTEIHKVRKNKYLKNIDTAKGLIKDGELIQCVLSQRFEKHDPIDSNVLLKYLSEEYPSEYVFQLIGEGFDITGSSPEMFLKVQDKKATIRPVAGTIGIDSDSDSAELTNALKKSVKDKAEHIMLVDLARNDLGRVSKRGSITVKKLMNIEKYRNVLHMVSEVTGQIADEFDSLDAFSCTFPIGTLVGAPKIRAAELISELELEGRGPYCGAIGWFSTTGDLETSTIIRSAIKKNGKVSFNAGGGIVYDSVPDVEYLETLYKIKAFKNINYDNTN